ncbi:MAG: hypothetical protein WC263_03655, partial [Candidatus Micrarchaeia archaeon]
MPVELEWSSRGKSGLKTLCHRKQAGDNVDVNNEKPAAESKPLRIWKPWEAIAAIGAVVLTFSFIGSLVAPRPNAPSDRSGRKYVIFQEFVQQEEI